MACEFSGRVRDAFASLGHDAWSCDLLPSEKPGNHIQGDVLKVISLGWQLMIAHPPCTFLCNAGVKHLGLDPSRRQRMLESVEFFMALLRAPIPHICVENPVPHHYAGLPQYSQIIQPWEHGDEATKRTCLWLKNLPFLIPTKIVGKGQRYFSKKRGRFNGAAWYMLPPANKNRWLFRSYTFQGIANAMTSQWGKEDVLEFNGEGNIELFGGAYVD